LPNGFVRIRHFGFLTNRFRTDRLALCRQLLASAASESPPLTPSESGSTWHCPRCGALMTILRRITPQELYSRAPFSTRRDAVPQLRPIRRAPRTPTPLCAVLCSEPPAAYLRAIILRASRGRKPPLLGCARTHRRSSLRRIGTKVAFNLHRPRPPQTPAPSFKSPYRKCPAIHTTASSRHSSAVTFPIKANDFSSKWIAKRCVVLGERS
jgi:hypothetical protein